MASYSREADKKSQMFPFVTMVKEPWIVPSHSTMYVKVKMFASSKC